MFQSPAHFDAEGNLKPLDEDSIVDENAEFEDLEDQDWVIMQLKILNLLNILSSNSNIWLFQIHT